MLTLLLCALKPVATAAPAEDYGEYSMMSQRHAGQFYSGGSLAGQWSWTPHGDESEVLWGDPSKWPPDSAEHFIHSGDWVVLDGWRSFGKYYVQRVNRELIGDTSCRNMTPLPSDGARQHYVQWNIPAQRTAFRRGALSRAVQRQGRGLLPFPGVVTAEFVQQRLSRDTNLHTAVGILVGQQWQRRRADHSQARTKRLPGPRCRNGLHDRSDFPHSWSAELHSDWIW